MRTRLPDLAHAAFDDVVNTEGLGHLLHIHRLALVDEGRVARDDQQIAEARQLGDDVLGQSVGEEILVRFAAHIGEGQHRDRQMLRRPAWRATGAAAEPVSCAIERSTG